MVPWQRVAAATTKRGKIYLGVRLFLPDSLSHGMVPLVCCFCAPCASLKSSRHLYAGPLFRSPSSTCGIHLPFLSNAHALAIHQFLTNAELGCWTSASSPLCYKPHNAPPIHLCYTLTFSSVLHIRPFSVLLHTRKETGHEKTRAFQKSNGWVRVSLHCCPQMLLESNLAAVWLFRCGT